MSAQFQVSSSPHIHSSASTTKIMLDVLIALLPACAASVVIFGWRSALLIVFSVVCCMAFEWISCLILKRPCPLGDLSAIVTGVLLAFNLPSTLPLWQAAVGCFVAIVVVKQLFGGLGCNFVNPALIGRVVMGLSFTGTMTAFGEPSAKLNDWAGVVAVTTSATSSATSAASADVVSAATPLSMISSGSGASLTFKELLFGIHPGVLGETCIIALLIGGLYLVIKRVINPVIPLTYVGTVFALTALFGGSDPLKSIMCGGLVLGAVFMATDYVTSPYTNWGKFVYAFGCGFITVLIRLYANASEGVSYSILLMNLIVPYINEFTRRRPFGLVKAKGGEAK